MENQEIFRAVLLGQLQAAKQRNPSFSMRAFSKKAGLSSSAVSEILAGKRNVSWRLAQRVLGNLHQDKQVIESVMASFVQSQRGLEVGYFDDADSTLSTVLISKEHLSEVRRILNKLIGELQKCASSGSNEDSYKITIALDRVGQVEDISSQP